MPTRQEGGKVLAGTLKSDMEELEEQEDLTLMKADKALRMILENGTHDHNVI